MTDSVKRGKERWNNPSRPLWGPRFSGLIPRFVKPETENVREPILAPAFAVYYP